MLSHHTIPCQFPSSFSRTLVSDVRPVLHLHHLNETGVTAEGGPTTVPGSPVHLSIDGNISTCAITNTLATPLPWLRIDLQRSYRINSILAMLSDSSGTAGVRYSSFVGENIDSLTGSDANQYCNALLIDGPSQWYRFRCRWPLKGRYVTLNLNDSGTAPKQLVVCELQIFYGNALPDFGHDIFSHSYRCCVCLQS